MGKYNLVLVYIYNIGICKPYTVVNKSHFFTGIDYKEVQAGSFVET